MYIRNEEALYTKVTILNHAFLSIIIMVNFMDSPLEDRLCLHLMRHAVLWQTLHAKLIETDYGFREEIYTEKLLQSNGQTNNRYSHLLVHR